MVPINSQVSKKTTSLTRIRNVVMQSSQNDNISLFSQPNAVESPHLLDYKANVGLSESTYSNTAFPLNIWENQCVDYQRCTQQNGFEFGAVPLTPIKLYEGKQTGNQPIFDIIQLHNTVHQSNRPNFLGCRIPVQTQLKPGASRFN